MQRFVNVRSTADSVEALEVDLYHVYVNNGISEIHEEAGEGDAEGGFDGYEIAEQFIYTKDEYIALIAQENNDLNDTVTSILTEIIPSLVTE